MKTKFVVQAYAFGIGFVDVGVYETAAEAWERESYLLKTPSRWCGGIIGETRIIERGER